MTKERPYRVVGTKLNPEHYALLKQLAEGKGMKVYELLQLCADTMVRYMSDQHNLSPLIERAMRVFEHIAGWRGSLSMASPTWDKCASVTSAVYIFNDERAVMVDNAIMGGHTEDLNVQHIMERVTSICCPDVYRRLRLLAKDMECSSIVELLSVLVDRAELEDYDTEIRDTFADCMRADNNRPVEYGARTRRSVHYDPDHLPVYARSEWPATTQTFSDTDGHSISFPEWRMNKTQNEAQ